MFVHIINVVKYTTTMTCTVYEEKQCVNKLK